MPSFEKKTIFAVQILNINKIINQTLFIMKKTLFFVLAVAFCLTLTAQRQVHGNMNLASQPCYKMPALGGGDEANFIPTERQSNYAARGINSDSFIGASNYTSATNTNARNTITWSPDQKTCAVTWTHGKYPENVRGTALNYFNKTTQEWDKFIDVDPFERVETGELTSAWAPGWGAHVYTAEGECVISHCAAEFGLLVNCRDKAGVGEWHQEVLHGPVQSDNNTTLSWPSIFAVGNTIHMVCVTNQSAEYLGYATYPLYYRSTDGGKTWEDKVHLGELMTENELYAISADEYVVTARENHVVIGYLGNDASYLESTDGGNTWERKVVYECTFDWRTSGVWHGPYPVPSTLAVAIGDDDVVHMAFSTQMKIRKPGDAVNEGHYWPMICGLFTWNDKMDPIKHEDCNLHYDFDGDAWIDGANGYAGFYDMPTLMDAPDLLGFGYFWWQNASWGDFLVKNYRDLGYITSPRLIAQGGKVYLMYTSVLQVPFLTISEDQFHRGIFLTVSYDNGATYDQQNNTSWLSYSPNLFWCEWDNYKGPTEDGEEMNGAPQIMERSENVYASMATSIGGGLLAFTWLNDVFPLGEGTQAWVEYPFNVVGLVIKANDAGKFWNTQEIWKGIGSKVDEKETIENLKIYPNPTGNIANIKVGTLNPYTISVTNIMGQVVYSVKGQGDTTINVTDFPAGIYVVNVKTAHASASQKLIVK